MSCLNLVNLCFVTDDGYAMPTCISLTSIRENRDSSTKCVCYILCKNVSVSNKQNFLKLSGKNFEIKLIDLLDLEDNSNFCIKNISATPTSLYKFSIPEILKHVDKVLYLDGDIIVCKDLAKLYNTDLKNFYVAAVRDCNAIKYEIPDNDYRYFNSGVMILNLKKMREDGVGDKMIKYRREGLNRLMDQDAFNYVLKDSVLLLSFEYNTQLNIFVESLRGNKQFNISRFKRLWKIAENSYEDILERSTILHYASMKPWKQYDVFYSEPWVKYYYLSPYRDKRLVRKDTHMLEITKSKTYIVGYNALLPIKLVKRMLVFSKDRVYRKFLKTFDKGVK